jgi:hypothetical protein
MSIFSLINFKYLGPRFLKSTEIHELNRHDKSKMNILIYKIYGKYIFIYVQLQASITVIKYDVY